jgi:hypothetical protein
MMKAIQVAVTGGVEVLKAVSIPKPTVPAGTAHSVWSNE